MSNKQKLINAVEQISTQPHRSLEEQFFIRILKQIWQIDISVPPSEVWRNLMYQNQEYFLSFMDLDDGDEKEEKWLLGYLEQVATALIAKKQDSQWKLRLVSTIDELNELRLKFQK